MDKKILGIIPARGGSKRIPGKNIRNFCGKPILAYSIEAALGTGLFEEVMVSTDSEEIAGTARRYKAAVPFLRSEDASGDYATTAEVLLEVLADYRKQGRTFDYMACIYPTAPFVTAKKLTEAFRILEQTKAAAVLPVAAFSYPPQRGYIVKDGRLEMKWKENYRMRSQDLEPLYHDCGQFYLYEVDRFLEQKGQITEGIVPIFVDELEMQDIDRESDWKLAELKYEIMCQRVIR
ncbi:MAG: pseudaminic acid cytidylyltransferase [Lachnospiraceae bacterium]|nr:pseudaminic acid cytidylyltransferase [Lachnospiraceae bacterium]